MPSSFFAFFHLTVISWPPTMCQCSRSWGNIGVQEQHSDPVHSLYASRPFLTFLALGCCELPLPVVYYSNSLVSLIKLSCYRANDYEWTPLLDSHFLASWVGTVLICVHWMLTVLGNHSFKYMAWTHRKYVHSVNVAWIKIKMSS